MDARVIMPLYGDLKYRDKLEYVTNYSVPVGWRSQYCGLFKADVDGVTYYFLDNEYYFKRRGLYGFRSSIQDLHRIRSFHDTGRCSRSPPP